MISAQLLATLMGALLVLAVAVGMSVYAIRHYIVRQRDWGITEGRITHVGLEETAHPRSGARLYGARVQYEYEVGGRNYHGSHIRPEYIYTAKKAFHREIEKRYREGKGVAVHYNPRNPTEAFLELGIPRVLLVLVGLGIVFLIAAFVLLAGMVSNMVVPNGQ